MNFVTITHCPPSGHAPPLPTEPEAHEFEVPTRISTPDELAQAALAFLPLDPPISTRLNWDALADSLFEGLSAVPAPNIAVRLLIDERALNGPLRLLPEVLEDVGAALSSEELAPEYRHRVHFFIDTYTNL